ncbi:MAG: 2-amino-4-hydroxy-6-hydroxymethyldihydropteridine diphosphokinase [Caldilineaceae bacterium]|nr:2-amino-4-hydroxy-6-hydroxymethyldihydropteridine diphosphokinase [Caldilineaceae bacterium]
MNQVLIALGSNVEKEKNVPAALALLRAQPAMAICAISPLYETTPIGGDGSPSGQPAFHNGALLVETALSPAALRDLLRQMEALLGRTRGADKFAARPIDLDIAMVRQLATDAIGAQMSDTADQENVQVDPDILRFIHLSVPLADVAPDWIVPQTGETLRHVAERHRLQNCEKDSQIPRKIRESI